MPGRGDHRRRHRQPRKRHGGAHRERQLAEPLRGLRADADGAHDHAWSRVGDKFRTSYPETVGVPRKTIEARGTSTEVGHGSVAIAAITSCTNTSNPMVMVGAGLVAKNAVAKGLEVNPAGQD